MCCSSAACSESQDSLSLCLSLSFSGTIIIKQVQSMHVPLLCCLLHPSQIAYSLTADFHSPLPASGPVISWCCQYSQCQSICVPLFTLTLPNSYLSNSEKAHALPLALWLTIPVAHVVFSPTCHGIELMQPLFESQGPAVCLLPRINQQRRILISAKEDLLGPGCRDLQCEVKTY